MKQKQTPLRFKSSLNFLKPNVICMELGLDWVRYPKFLGIVFQREIDLKVYVLYSILFILCIIHYIILALKYSGGPNKNFLGETITNFEDVPLKKKRFILNNLNHLNVLIPWWSSAMGDPNSSIQFITICY